MSTYEQNIKRNELSCQEGDGFLNLRVLIKTFKEVFCKDIPYVTVTWAVIFLTKFDEILCDNIFKNSR